MGAETGTALTPAVRHSDTDSKDLSLTEEVTLNGQ